MRRVPSVRELCAVVSESGDVLTTRGGMRVRVLDDTETAVVSLLDCDFNEEIQGTGDSFPEALQDCWDKRAAAELDRIGTGGIYLRSGSWRLRCNPHPGLGGSGFYFETWPGNWVVVRGEDIPRHIQRRLYRRMLRKLRAVAGRCRHWA